jgi:hypothetical protein
MGPPAMNLDVGRVVGFAWYRVRNLGAGPSHLSDPNQSSKTGILCAQRLQGGNPHSGAAISCVCMTLPLTGMRLQKSVCRSAPGHLLQLFGVSSSLHRDLGGGFVDVPQIVGREFD